MKAMAIKDGDGSIRLFSIEDAKIIELPDAPQEKPKEESAPNWLYALIIIIIVGFIIYGGAIFR